MGGQVASAEFQMPSGSKQFEDSSSRLVCKVMGLDIIQGSTNSESNHLGVSEGESDCSSPGAIYCNANGGLKSDFVSKLAPSNGVDSLDLKKEKYILKEASNSETGQPEKVITSEGIDIDQCTNGRMHKDFPTTDADELELTQTSNHVAMCRADCTEDSSIESPHDSVHSDCHGVCHEDKHMLLDPNAEEFIPYPLPSHNLSSSVAPLSSPVHTLGENPVVYGNGVDVGPVFFSHNSDNGCQHLPSIFGSNRSPGYDPISPAASAAQSAWNGPSVRYVVQSDFLPQFPPLSLPVLPPTNCQQESRACFPHQRSFTEHGNNSSMAASRRHPGGIEVATIMGREHVTRSLLLTGVPVTNEDGKLRSELEQWGPVRAIGLGKWNEGSVTVCYFDLRHAKDALKDIQEQHLRQQQRMKQRYQLLQKQQCQNDNDSTLPQQDIIKADLAKLEGFTQGDDNNDTSSFRGLIGGKAVWAQYVVAFGPESSIDSMNQGTLVVFNLDADVSLDCLRAAFEVHGPVKEVRETPVRRQHKFVEFFDVRDAARALAALDGKLVCGRQVKIEFSRPGGQARRARNHDLIQAQCQLHGVCGPCGGSGSGLSTAVGHTQGQQFMWGWNGECHGSTFPCSQPFVMPNYGQIPSVAPYNSVSCVVPHWNGPEVHPQPLGYPQHSMASPSTLPLLPVTEVLPFASAIDRDFGNGAYCGSSRGPPYKCYSHSNFQNADGHGFGGSLEARYRQHTGKQVISSRTNHNLAQTRYLFDESEAESSSSSNPRTTLMIRNIPNKYSQQMLLELLDRHCIESNKQVVDPEEPISAYDFVYLPIDFKNKCNLGYAFVNFTSVQATIRLYKAFHEQQWEAFNSRKVCQVTYARVQGKSALEEHFRNSRFNCEVNEYLPLMFSPPRTGIECPPPTLAVCPFGNGLQEGNGRARISDPHAKDED